MVKSGQIILLLGPSQDPCLRGVMTRLERQGSRIFFIPEERLQRDLQLRWELPDITGYLRLGNRTIPVDQLKAVLVRLRQSLYANMGPGQTPW